jgi:hypothetical protein
MKVYVGHGNLQWRWELGKTSILEGGGGGSH